VLTCCTDSLHLAFSRTSDLWLTVYDSTIILWGYRRLIWKGGPLGGKVRHCNPLSDKGVPRFPPANVHTPACFSSSVMHPTMISAQTKWTHSQSHTWNRKSRKSVNRSPKQPNTSRKYHPKAGSLSSKYLLMSTHNYGPAWGQHSLQVYTLWNNIMLMDNDTHSPSSWSRPGQKMWWK
jgi:hypothetical protein